MINEIIESPIELTQERLKNKPKEVFHYFNERNSLLNLVQEADKSILSNDIKEWSRTNEL